jgi:hypothetical protein
MALISGMNWITILDLSQFSYFARPQRAHSEKHSTLLSRYLPDVRTGEQPDARQMNQVWMYHYCAVFTKPQHDIVGSLWLLEIKGTS